MENMLKRTVTEEGDGREEDGHQICQIRVVGQLCTTEFRRDGAANDVLEENTRSKKGTSMVERNRTDRAPTLASCAPPGGARRMRATVRGDDPSPAPADRARCGGPHSGASHGGGGRASRDRGRTEEDSGEGLGPTRPARAASRGRENRPSRLPGARPPAGGHADADVPPPHTPASPPVPKDAATHTARRLTRARAAAPAAAGRRSHKAAAAARARRCAHNRAPPATAAGSRSRRAGGGRREATPRRAASAAFPGARANPPARRARFKFPRLQ